ncbi:MAG: NADH-quinone oxidoreductase subunit M [Thermoplasmata archaeon]
MILLPFLLLLPLIFSIIPLFSGKNAKFVSSILSFIMVIFAVIFYFYINTIFTTSQFLGIDLSLSVTYLSYPLILLVSIIVFIAIVYQEKTIEPSYFSYILFLEFSLFGVFLTQNIFIFYIFWELVLIPSYFMIGKWGEKRKDYTALKFLIYTHVGSVLMLVSIFIVSYQYYLINNKFNFDFNAFFTNLPSGNIYYVVVLGFFLAFFIKLPTFPLHTWAPDVYVESPTTSSMIFSGLLSKMGAYGLFAIFIHFKDVSLGWFILSLGILTLIYAAFSALSQKDLKKMAAYTSIGHMGFISISLGVYFVSGSVLALIGGMFMMFAHGLIIPIIFGTIGSIERSTGTRAIRDLGGLTKMMPNLAFLMTGGFLASLGLPGLAGFVAEFSVVIGSWQTLTYISFLIVFGLVVSASYHIWALQRVIYGPYNNYLGKIDDMIPREFWPMLILFLLVLIFGIYPTPIYSLFQYYLGGVA